LVSKKIAIVFAKNAEISDNIGRTLTPALFSPIHLQGLKVLPNSLNATIFLQNNVTMHLWKGLKQATRRPYVLFELSLLWRDQRRRAKGCDHRRHFDATSKARKLVSKYHPTDIQRKIPPA
jgi:hypothetical protein